MSDREKERLQELLRQALHYLDESASSIEGGPEDYLVNDIHQLTGAIRYALGEPLVLTASDFDPTEE